MFPDSWTSLTSRASYPDCLWLEEGRHCGQLSHVTLAKLCWLIFWSFCYVGCSPGLLVTSNDSSRGVIGSYWVLSCSIWLLWPPKSSGCPTSCFNSTTSYHWSNNRVSCLLFSFCIKWQDYLLLSFERFWGSSRERCDCCWLRFVPPRPAAGYSFG